MVITRDGLGPEGVAVISTSCPWGARARSSPKQEHLISLKGERRPLHPGWPGQSAGRSGAPGVWWPQPACPVPARAARRGGRPLQRLGRKPADAGRFPRTMSFLGMAKSTSCPSSSARWIRAKATSVFPAPQAAPDQGPALAPAPEIQKFRRCCLLGRRKLVGEGRAPRSPGPVGAGSAPCQESAAGAVLPHAGTLQADQAVQIPAVPAGQGPGLLAPAAAAGAAAPGTSGKARQLSDFSPENT